MTEMTKLLRRSTFTLVSPAYVFLRKLLWFTGTHLYAIPSEWTIDAKWENFSPFLGLYGSQITYGVYCMIDPLVIHGNLKTYRAAWISRTELLIEGFTSIYWQLNHIILSSIINWRPALWLYSGMCAWAFPIAGNEIVRGVKLKVEWKKKTIDCEMWIIKSWIDSDKRTSSISEPL